MASSGGPASAPPAGLSPGEGEDPDMHHDIARDIGQLVEIMILDAKHNSENKVGKEIQKLKTKMEQMNDKLKMISERLSRLEPNSGGLLKSDLQKSLGKLEEVWEGEVGALKHELWQTIQAHNHNADLLKHHKDAIDQVQTSMSESASSTPDLEQVHAQLVQVDRVMQREMQKDNQIDQLMQRLTVVQQQLTAGVGGWPPGSGLPPFPMSAGVGAANAAAAAAKKSQQRKAPKAKAPKAGGAAVMPNLRAEAPEFVPTGYGD